jgi:phage-related protein
MARKKTLPPESGGAGADREHAAALLAKPVIWVCSSKDDRSALPGPVKTSFGHRLRQVQNGETPLDVKPLTQFGTGVFELRERFDKNAYRLMYVVNLKKAVYVLHAFMKKSKSGSGIPKTDTELIEARLKRAQALDAED